MGAAYQGRYRGRSGVKGVLVAIALAALSPVGLIARPLAASRSVLLPARFNSFLQVEFTDLGGTPLNGQTLSVDFLFDGGAIDTASTVWAELLLRTGPHNSPGPQGDYPYTQYVVFGSGSSAYLIAANGSLLQVPMSNWKGGFGSSPGPLLGVLSTSRGWAGADLVGKTQGAKIAGIHFDLVLPNTGETLYGGSIGVQTGVNNGVPGPTISDITVSSLTATTAAISWTTEQLADGQVEYGPTSFYGSSTALGPTLSNVHSASLTGLLPNTTYHYRVRSRDAAGNPTTSQDFTFLTPYAVSDLQALSNVTDGIGGLTSAYAEIQPQPDSAVPAGLAIVEYRQNGILVNAAGVPATPAISSGRIRFEGSADGKVKTGIAMVNPNTVEAFVQFEFRDNTGSVFRAGNFMLTGKGAQCDPAVVICNQLTRFLDEAPFLSGSGVEGTFSFTSTVPVAAVGLHGFYNERAPSDFLVTTLPVWDLSQPASRGTRVIAHFASGEGWISQIVLANTTDKVQSGTLYFTDSAGGEVRDLSINGQPGSSANYMLGADGSRRFLLTTSLPTLVSGSVRVVPTDGGESPMPLVIFSYKPGAVTISQAAVPVIMGKTFRMYAETAADPPVVTGIAVANATTTAGTVLLEMTDLSGKLIGSAGPLPLPANGRIAGFLHELIPSLAGQNHRGLVRITTDVPVISVTGIQGLVNNRPLPDFLIANTSPVIEDAPPGVSARFFPFVMNGGGYTTRFVLFSGAAAQNSGGTLNFVRSDGSPFSLDLH